MVKSSVLNTTTWYLDSEIYLNRLVEDRRKTKQKESSYTVKQLFSVYIYLPVFGGEEKA